MCYAGLIEPEASPKLFYQMGAVSRHTLTHENPTQMAGKRLSQSEIERQKPDTVHILPAMSRTRPCTQEQKAPSALHLEIKCSVNWIYQSECQIQNLKGLVAL